MRLSLFSAVAMAAVVAAWAAPRAEAVSISRVLEGKECAFSFTYDDGTRDHYETAFPMQKKYGFPATFLIITSLVEDDADPARPRKNCSWDELKEMSDGGMEIASHTHNHKNMRQIESADVTREMTAGKPRPEVFAMREKNWPTLLSEVTTSKKLLEEHTGKPVRTYAFAGNACPDWTGRLMNEVHGCVRAGNIRLATGRGDTKERYRQVVNDKILVTNQFSCAMIHGLGTKTPGGGWNPPAGPEVIESLFKIIAENIDRIHVDTYANNNAYEWLSGRVRLAPQKDGTMKLVPARGDDPNPPTGEVWLRVARGETVAVNGTPATPNAYGAILAPIGATITVEK